MAYQQKEGDIAVFKNDSDNERAPKWKGKALINGQVMEVALWEKSDTMLAGSVKLNDYKPSQHDQQKQNGYQPQDDLEDEIPF